MYDVGQGNNIKGKPQVFQIEFADTIKDMVYPCDCDKFDKSKLPKQFPLGDTGEYGYKEDYEDNTQHKKAGEPSDLVLFIVGICLVIFVLMIMKFDF